MMKWFLNLRTATKLIMAFVGVAVISAGVGIYALTNLNMMKGNIDGLYGNNLTSIRDLSATQFAYQNLRILVRDISMAQTEANKDKLVQNIPGYQQAVEDTIQSYRTTIITPPEQDELKIFDSEWAAYKKVYDDAVQLARKENQTEFIAYKENQLAAQGEKLRSSLGRLITINEKLAEQKSDSSAAAYTNARNMMIGVLLLSLILSIVIGYSIARMISRPLQNVVEVVNRMAQGDFRENLHMTTKDEVGQLATSMDQMIDNLRGLVSGILISSQSVAAAAQQISASTEEIASGSSTQAQSAQSIAELFTELSSAIQFVAKSAEQAAELTNNTVQTAGEGGAIVEASIYGMRGVNTMMSRLEEDSLKIGEIIEVIDDIADQTNLLALNAAIEAARAGDQGRGFAVVADEVRKLAERSSAATKEITSIIKKMQNNTKQSVTAVLDSVTQSERTGEAFNRIVEMVGASAGKVNEIAAACQEEAAQASEVMLSVDQVASSSQESAAASEEAAATCQSLASLAEDLNTAVAVFKIN
ncbi:HAMP domain-containing methyl-accepting chemotaxis protein [Paenibacillus filicis]|uniref:HAMP domain-containing methyl-accepting chemotaxis protein n=1 Tax=Paenibacillus filicis TaxID=669464 RepID=A0ABU9DYE6_9BACL